MAGVIGILISIGAVIFLFYGMIKDFVSMIRNIPSFQHVKYSPEEKLRLSLHLKENNYFQKLSPEGKLRFMDRLIRFMINKEFFGKEGLVVTEEMRVQISASAIQLSFGLDEFIFPTFQQFYIYPDIFTFGLTPQQMKGGTTPNGRMLLSWKDFVSGNADHTDRINLGLHEFSHALKIELEDGNDYDKYFTASYPNWEESGMEVMQLMRDGKSDFLRKYGSVNIHEFFAVSVEHFFERPAAFKETLPKLYNHFLWLLNQDPLNDHDDFHCSKNQIKFENPSPAQNLKVRDQWHWSLSILVSGIFMGIPLVLYLIAQTEISIAGLFLLIGIVSATNRFTLSYFRERRILSNLQFFFYSFLGIGIWGTAFLLTINLLLPVGQPTNETYNVVSTTDYVLSEKSWVRFELENKAFKNYPFLRTFHYDSGDRHPDKVTLTFRRGILGIRTIKKTTIQTGSYIYKSR